MDLLLLGMNHRTAPLPLRERVAYSPEEAVDVLRAMKIEGAANQALLISTCNRTELYAVSPTDGGLDRLKTAIFLDRVGEEMPEGDWLYRHENQNAVEHLFKVACGLDSMVLGEQQILGQVKTAYEFSRRAETTGAVLHRLASRAFRVGKRARTETAIGEGAVSVAFAAVELAEKVFHNLEGRGVLVVGAGDNARLCVEHLLGRRCRPILITNRTQSRAEALAQEFDGETVPFDRMSEAMERVDIVVSTTGAPDTVIDAAMVRKAMPKRASRSLVFIDIAVPRDIHPDVDEVGNVFRFDIDALHNIVDQNLVRRQREVALVERLIQNEIQNFMNWWNGLAATPVIRELHSTFEKIRQEELDRNQKRFHESDLEQVELFSRNLVRKLLMGVTMEIKGYRPENPKEGERLAALRHLFHLDAVDDQSQEEKDEDFR